QRKGLNVGGRPLPSFVIDTDVENNLVFTGQGEDHPGLYRSGLKIEWQETHWIRPDHELQEGQSRSYLVRIRYRQKLVEGTLLRQNDHLYIRFNEPQRGVASGQFAAWYDGEELIGSGVIH
ncbi:MAG: tRNA 2-thiouridine(34) synthase MnmA, partial [Flavobacteriales bacterium]|nr:tRNA 2-thiouridine(34) synthase MnmA [Flavobacteriales bacterium]